MTDEPRRSRAAEDPGPPDAPPTDETGATAPAETLAATARALRSAERPDGTADEAIERATAAVGKEDR